MQSKQKKKLDCGKDISKIEWVLCTFGRYRNKLQSKSHPGNVRMGGCCLLYGKETYPKAQREVWRCSRRKTSLLFKHKR